MRTYKENELQQAIDRFMQLADDMASAATTFNSHGYEIFIQARQQMKDALEIELICFKDNKDINEK